MTINSKITKKTLLNLEKKKGVKLTFGSLIWAIREADGISQSEFAAKLGIRSRQQLNDIEHGKPVSAKLAARYAEILGYSREQFIRLSLQDMIDREGLGVEVEVTLMKSKMRRELDSAA
jgi:transcriptional regulator with XRE-family HTH domain